MEPNTNASTPTEWATIVERTTREIDALDSQRESLASERRKAIWQLTKTMSFAEIAKLANMHRGAVHKDLSRHPEDIA